MPIISPTAISPHRIGGKNLRSYWKTRGVVPGADATLITEAINEALQNYSYVKITEAGIYDINGTIYIPSNTTLEFVAGCTLRKETGAEFYHMIANDNIQTLTADTNVTLIGNGLNCDINGIDNVGTPAGPSQRGHLMFYQVNGLTITGIETTTIDENQFFIHAAEVSNVVMRDIDVEGWKDGIHFGVAHNVLLEDIRTATGDDGIALNAGDYYVSNPTVGNITNVIIRRWTDDVYTGQGGSGCLLLSRSWENWTSGHNYLINDYVNNAGNIYQKISAGTQAAANAPTHTSGSVTGADGIEWVWLQTGTINHADIIGVTFEDCTWASGRPLIRTAGSAVSDPMRSFYPGTGAQSIVDGIIIDNLTITPAVTSKQVFLCDVNTGSVEFKNIAYTLPSTDNLFYINPREETFTIDSITFNNCSIDLEADRRLVVMPALTYVYAVNTINIISSDIRTDDSTRASLVSLPAASVVSEIVLNNSEFHHLRSICTAQEDNTEVTINASGSAFDETCERLLFVFSADNCVITFNASDCVFGRTTEPMFENETATSLITVATTGSTGQTIPNLYKGYVDVSASDLFGADMISNGEFTDGTGWTAATGWSIGSGVATYDDATDSAVLSQSAGAMLAPVKPLTDYKVTFNIAIASGEARIQIINSTAAVQYKAQAYYASGNREVLFTTPASVGVGGIGFRGFTTSGASFTIDKITMQEV